MEGRDGGCKVVQQSSPACRAGHAGQVPGAWTTPAPACAHSWLVAHTGPFSFCWLFPPTMYGTCAMQRCPVLARLAHLRRMHIFPLRARGAWTRQGGSSAPERPPWRHSKARHGTAHRRTWHAQRAEGAGGAWGFGFGGGAERPGGARAVVCTPAGGRLQTDIRAGHRNMFRCGLHKRKRDLNL